MQQHLIRQALGALKGQGAKGIESNGVSATPQERADALAEQARKALPILIGTSTNEAVRLAHASALIEDGRKALKEIASLKSTASFSSNQLAGLEAIVRLTGRPSLPIRGGVVDEVPQEWSELMQLAAVMVEQSIASVGRLRVAEFEDPFLGTAFRVGPDLAMTNVHVAINFAERVGNRWKVGTGLTPLLDFLAEDGSLARCEFRVTGIESLHPDPRLDLAILRLERVGEQGQQLPLALPLNGDLMRVQSAQRVYVIGYPAADERHDVAVVDAIFGRPLAVKRIAPGEILLSRQEGFEFTHDCSTLRGNSGSCVLDFSTHRVLGLHRSGMAGIENRAASVAYLRHDPLLGDLGIEFKL